MGTLPRNYAGSEPHGHIVQFYKADEPLLNRNVGRFLWEGFLRGDGLLVIATAKRRECLVGHLAHLGVDVAISVADSQLALLDASEMLERFMIEGEPRWDLFHRAMSDVLKFTLPRVPGTRISAYGEMVGILWEAGQTDAAIRLEEYWNTFLHGTGITLFCGYPIDVFGADFSSAHVHNVLSAHTHLLPSGDLGDAFDRAMNEILGPRAAEVRVSMDAAISCSPIPLSQTESAILWLRSNCPDNAETILASAREYYLTGREGTAVTQQRLTDTRFLSY